MSTPDDDGIRREHPELTEEAEIAARFAAQLMGGTIASGPPPAGSMLAWMLAHPGWDRDDITAEYARRGVDWEAVWLRGECTEEDERRLCGEAAGTDARPPAAPGSSAAY